MKLALYISRVEEVPDFFAQRSGTASTQKFKNRFHSYLGEKTGSGVYFYQIRAGDFKAVRKMVILK